MVFSLKGGKFKRVFRRKMWYYKRRIQKGVRKAANSSEGDDREKGDGI